MDIDYNIFNLNNGIKVIYIPRNDNNISSISVFCKVGQRNEPDDLTGASHFLEHMLFKGTKLRPKSKNISGELDSIGAYFNAYTDKNLTSYIVKLDSKYFKKGIDILSDMLLNSKIDDDDVKIEKQVVIEEISRARDNPADLISDKIYELIYKDHPLEHSIGSTNEKISNYNRNRVYEYYKKYYSSNNIIISICSNLKINIIKENINNSFFPKYPIQNFKLTNYTPLKIQTKRRYSSIFRKLEQTHISLGFPIEGISTQDRYCLDLIKVILAGNMSSRLFTDLREKNGLSYNVSIDLSYYKECGNFIIYTSVDKNSLFIKNNHSIVDNTINDNMIDDSTIDNNINNLFTKNIEIETITPGCIPIILENLIRLKSQKVLDKELENAQGFLRGHLIIEKEDSHSLSDYFGKQLLLDYKPILNFGYILDKYNNITPKQIRRICRKYFNFNKMNIATIGNCYENDLKDFVENYNFL